LASSQIAMEGPMTATGTTALDTLRIMIVDDDKVMRGILRRMFEQGGVQKVTLATGGEDALAQLAMGADATPDVILCDLYMKGMDGLELCRKLRKSESAALKQVPIIILTAEHTDMVHQVARQVGANLVLTKPISTSELLKEIGRIVGFSLAVLQVDAFGQPLQGAA
jgi:CheY-like chemotaxis protein